MREGMLRKRIECKGQYGLDKLAAMKRKQSATAEEMKADATATVPASGIGDFAVHVSEGKEYTSKLVSTLGDGRGELFSIRFDPEDKQIAAGCGDGTVRVFSLALKKEIGVLRNAIGDPSAITAVRWRPLEAKGASSHVLLTVNAQGQVQHWLTSACKLLHTISEPGMLFAADYAADGSTFATAGDGKIVKERSFLDPPLRRL